MRTQWVWLLCLEHVIRFANGSFFSLSSGRHGTVAEAKARAALLHKSARREEPNKDKPLTTATGVNDAIEKSEPQQSVDFKMPKLSANNDPPLPGLQADSPESPFNPAVKDYNIAMPTPQPAAFAGVYCRGGACQFRVAPPAPTLPPLVTPPPIPVGGDMLSGREFCRGLSCLDTMGWPGSAEMAQFNLNCVHLFNDVGGGMLGEDMKRSIPQVHDSFATKVCPKRVGLLEVGACPVFADTFVGAESPKVDKTTLGGTVEICKDTFLWIMAFKQAEIDMKLTAAALPKGNSLLAADLNRLGTGGVGPSSPRGTKWREYAYNHGIKQAPPAMPRQLSDDGSFVAGSLLETKSSTEFMAGTPKPLPVGADTPDNTPRGLPKYLVNAPCETKDVHVTSQADSKYQIAPGNPDGPGGNVIPPVEVSGDLFTYCSNQMSEIMMGFAQTAPEIVKMSGGWCKWQASVSSWVGKQQEYGHPDWSHRTCSGMEQLMGFAMRDNLADTKTGFSAQEVCKKIFGAIGSVHKTDSIVKDAWVMSLRGAPSSGIPTPDDAEMKKLLREAQDYANSIFGKMRAQKNAFDSINGQKMDMGSFNSVELPAAPSAPDIPDSSDVATALLSLSVQRVRESKRVGITLASHLEPWGRAV